MSKHEDDVNFKTEERILTQEDVNEQMKSYIVALAK